MTNDKDVLKELEVKGDAIVLLKKVSVTESLDQSPLCLV